MPQGGKLAEHEVVALLQSGCLLVVSQLTRAAQPVSVQAFVVDPETEREWVVAPTTESWEGRWVVNTALGRHVPDQRVVAFPRLPEDTVVARGGVQWKLCLLTLCSQGDSLRGRLSYRSVHAVRRIRWRSPPARAADPRPYLGPAEAQRRLARGQALVEVRYWRGGPRAEPKGRRRAWVQDPYAGEATELQSTIMNPSWNTWRYHQVLLPHTQLRRQGGQRLTVGKANWEVTTFTTEPSPDWLGSTPTLRDEEGGPIPLRTQARIMEAIERIEEQVSERDWVMA